MNHWAEGQKITGGGQCGYVLVVRRGAGGPSEQLHDDEEVRRRKKGDFVLKNAYRPMAEGGVGLN